VFPGGADDAARAAQEIKSGMSAADAAARFHGRDSGKLNGEEFYFAARLHLGEQLFGVARAVPDGGVSEPADTPDGVHVIVVKRNLAPVQIDFPAARDRVLSDYRADAIKRVTHDDETFLRKRANILVSEDMK
jgi:parvulin-like peptidyl-prolyl isomerase